MDCPEAQSIIKKCGHVSGSVDHMPKLNAVNGWKIEKQVIRKSLQCPNAKGWQIKV